MSTLGIYPIHISGIYNIRVYIIAVVTVLITTFFITRKKDINIKKGKDLLIYGLDGMMMEVPQRLMMQSFVYGILKLFDVSQLNMYTIIATGLIWCMGIIMQTVIFKKKLDRDVFFDVLSSLVFSLGIGYVYQQTGLVIISMIAHFCERILSYYIIDKIRKFELNR